MTSFTSSIEKVIKGIADSNSAANQFDYSDEFVEELHFRSPQPGLVEFAQFDLDFAKAINLSERVSLEKVICLEVVTVRKEYQKQGYMTELIERLERNFPHHYLCITNVKNAQFAKWIAKRNQWKGTPYFHMAWNTDGEAEFNKQLMKENFVRLPIKKT